MNLDINNCLVPLAGPKQEYLTQQQDQKFSLKLYSYQFHFCTFNYVFNSGTIQYEDHTCDFRRNVAGETVVEFIRTVYCVGTHVALQCPNDVNRMTGMSRFGSDRYQVVPGSNTAQGQMFLCDFWPLRFYLGGLIAWITRGYTHLLGKSVQNKSASSRLKCPAGQPVG